MAAQESEDNETAPRFDPEFANVVASVEDAIAQNRLPKRIVQGSSGSYFCYNLENEIVGVFKPKNEEPYGALNPKWGKFIQKHFCCWCYGRDCLVMNQGYLSEAGASIVDECLDLNIVPKTKVVRLTSSSFHYSRFDRARANAVKSASRRFPDTVGKHLRQGLPPKVGSFQLFVKGFTDASVFFRHHDINTLGEKARADLRRQFEYLVCLDYITRNTDRGNDNWLIKYTAPGPEGTGESIEVAAIDNGLSFPYKHPDNWRAYPFHWAWLPLAKVPFSDETAQKMLPVLRSDEFIERMGDRLYVLFSQDPAFSRTKFKHQMAVLRGQVLNLRRALEERKTPEQLVHMPTARVYLKRTRAANKPTGYRQVFQKRMPFFTWL